MNKQIKTKLDPATGQSVIISRGIEWTDFSWNPIGGCRHGCRWGMPDGTIAICYAEATTHTMTTAYPHGFEHHYWRPHMLEEPERQKTPSRIFMDSMSDLMGNWVPEEQINQVFDVCRRAHWHHFQLLTKNANRLLKFELPPNVWAGVSAPPTFMFGRELTREQQWGMVNKQLDVLHALKLEGHPVCWMSIEPLSFDIASVFYAWLESRGPKFGEQFDGATIKLPLDWAVVGAASNGPKYFQPDPQFCTDIHVLLAAQGVKIFHKGNLTWAPHLEEFPATAATLKQEALL